MGIDLQIVMTDRALFGLEDTPARVAGYGPIPAALARDLLRHTTQAAPHPRQPTNSSSDDTGNPQTHRGDGGQLADLERARVWVRLLYTHPTTGQLAAMDSHRREMPAGVRRLLIPRDEVCRTPWCDAPIRHADHAVPARRRRPQQRGQRPGPVRGLQLHQTGPRLARHPPPGPRRRPQHHPHHPTGHHYRSRPPHPVGTPPQPQARPPAEPADQASPLEDRLQTLLPTA